jgi:hypothetical protein
LVASYLLVRRRTMPSGLVGRSPAKALHKDIREIG